MISSRWVWTPGAPRAGGARSLGRPRVTPVRCRTPQVVTVSDDTRSAVAFDVRAEPGRRRRVGLARRRAVRRRSRCCGCWSAAGWSPLHRPRPRRGALGVRRGTRAPAAGRRTGGGSSDDRPPDDGARAAAAGRGATRWCAAGWSVAAWLASSAAASSWCSRRASRRWRSGRARTGPTRSRRSTATRSRPVTPPAPGCASPRPCCSPTRTVPRRSARCGAGRAVAAASGWSSGSTGSCSACTTPSDVVAGWALGRRRSRSPLAARAGAVDVAGDRSGAHHDRHPAVAAGGGAQPDQGDTTWPAFRRLVETARAAARLGAAALVRDDAATTPASR